VQKYLVPGPSYYGDSKKTQGPFVSKSCSDSEPADSLPVTAHSVGGSSKARGALPAIPARSTVGHTMAGTWEEVCAGRGGCRLW
jgi:hypothetical protein